MSALVKPVYTFIKGVCPIYAHGTGEYVGSAFLIRDINYLCHFPEVEGRARATHHYLSFNVWCAEAQGLLHKHGCAGVQKSASERFERFQFDCQQQRCLGWVLGGPEGLEGLT